MWLGRWHFQLYSLEVHNVDVVEGGWTLDYFLGKGYSSYLSHTIGWTYQESDEWTSYISDAVVNCILRIHNE